MWRLLGTARLRHTVAYGAGYWRQASRRYLAVVVASGDFRDQTSNKLRLLLDCAIHALWH